MFTTSDSRYVNMNETFDGSAPINGDRMLVSIESYPDDLELVLAHELLHLDGRRHRPEFPTEVENFRTLERQCSGGRESNLPA